MDFESEPPMNAIPPPASSHAVIRALTRMLEFVLIAAMAVLTLDVLWGVASRFIWSNQSAWTEELARYLMIWVGLLGSCLAFEKRAHLGVDYFVGKFHPTGRQILRVGAYLAILAFAVGVLMVGGWELVSRTLARKQIAPTLGIPKGWVYLAVPISGVFTVIFSLGHLVDVLRRGEPIPPKNEPEAGQ